MLAVSTNYTLHNLGWPSLNRQNCAALTHGIGNVLFRISSAQFRNADSCIHVGEPPGPIKSTRLFWLAVRLLTCYRLQCGRGQLKCDGTRAETRFRLSAKRTSPFKSAGASVQSTTGSRGVRISGSNAGYTIFRGSVKGTVYPLHSPVSPSLPLPRVIACHHVSTGL